MFINNFSNKVTTLNKKNKIDKVIKVKVIKINKLKIEVYDKILESNWL